ncbi:MAG: BrnT family toxin [Phormidesmis sp. CAN_BIN44]|nr:BrnT family toxin [Phormidesmis sp. CAN_BIN44]
MLPGFEWNEQKAQVNLSKHGVSFAEATTVFDDPQCLFMDDPKHSIGESRFLILGYSVVERLLLVVHCDRGNTIRIIGARPATLSERRSYEQGC